MLSVIANPPRIALPIVDSTDVFPVRRVYCVGRNYPDHAREMGADPEREPPFFFLKPADVLQSVPPGETAHHPYPPGTTDYQFEVEMVAALSHGGHDIAPADAPAHVYGYAVGLDMTRRDLQRDAKRRARPWDTAKAADRSGPIGPLHRAALIGHPAHGAIGLEVDGHPRQAGDLRAMIWSVPELIARLSRLFTLHPGDLVFTGTPAGVGPVERGQTMRAHVAGLGAIAVQVV